jgi:hypothetical protein
MVTLWLEGAAEIAKSETSVMIRAVDEYCVTLGLLLEAFTTSVYAPVAALLSAVIVMIDLAGVLGVGVSVCGLKLYAIPRKVFKSRLTADEKSPTELTVISYFADCPGAMIAEEGEIEITN